MTRPKYKFMMTVLNQCSKKNLGKAVITILFSTMIQLVILTFAIMPFALFGKGLQSANSGVSISQLGFSLFCIALVFFAFTIILIMNYGLMVIMSRMVEKKHVTIGYLFAGFKEKSRVIKAALCFITMIVLLSFVVVIVILAVGIDPMALISTEKISFDLILYTLISSTAALFVLLPFVFVWMFLYTDNNCSAIKAIGKAYKLFYMNFFHFIGFIIYAGGKYLSISIISSVILKFIPLDTNNNLQVISFVLSVISLVTEYLTLVRIYLSIPIYFYSFFNNFKTSTSNISEVKMLNDSDQNDKTCDIGKDE